MLGSNLRQILAKSGAMLSTVAGIITVETYIKSFKNKKLLENLNKEIERNIKLEERLSKIMDSKISMDDTNKKILEAVLQRNEHLEKAKTSLDKVKSISDNLINASEEVERNSKIKEISETVGDASENLSKSHTKMKEILDLILNSGDGSNSNSMFIDRINYFIIAYKKFLSTLTLIELGALCHIILSILILFCLYSLIAVFYGDSLIRYLRLEDRFPKLARFIQIRRKFQQYYFFLNICLIIITILYVIYVNLIVFFN